MSAQTIVPLLTLDNGVQIPALAAVATPGVRGGPAPEEITRETYGREIPEA